MAKRYTDTDKWKKPFIRGLQGAYKLLWVYILDECDHAGIWQVDIEVASIRLGEPTITIAGAINAFGDKIQVFANGEKWFIQGFIDFQYNGQLNPANKTHNSVIKLLNKNKLSPDVEIITPNSKPLTSPLQGVKDKDKDKDIYMDMDKGGPGGNCKPLDAVAEPAIIQVEEIENKPAEEPEKPKAEKPKPAIFLSEDEKDAAMIFLKGHGVHTLVQMQHKKTPEEIEKLFIIFLDEKSALGELGKTPDEVVKHFFRWVPYHKVYQNRQNETEAKINGSGRSKPIQSKATSAIAAHQRYVDKLNNQLPNR